MFALYKFIGSFIVPPGLFILILLLLAVRLRSKPSPLRRARQKGAAVPLALLAAILYIMSVPAGASLITGPLEDMYKTGLPPDDAEAAILVLSGGSSYDEKGRPVQPAPQAMERLFTAVRLAKGRGGDTALILSGGDVFGEDGRSEAAAMLDAARTMGWDGESVLEEASRTTAENMRNSAKIIQNMGIGHVIIITNAFHLPRAAALAENCMPYAQRYPYPSGRLTDKIKGISSFLPSAQSLNASCLGVREWTALAAYKAVNVFKR